MLAYRTKKKVSAQGKIQLDALPFAAGEIVEIIVLASSEQIVEEAANKLISLKGSVLAYSNPTDPVASDDWSIMQ